MSMDYRNCASHVTVSSREPYSGSIVDSGYGIQGHGSQQEESFDMYNEYPVHGQSDNYIEIESPVAERLR